MGIFDVRAGVDWLTVAGARCSDGSVQEKCAAVAELAALDAAAKEWRRVEIASGDDLEELQFVFVTGDDERVRLLTEHDAAGRKEGAMHIAVLDRSLTRVEHWSAPAPTYSGGFCAFEGTARTATRPRADSDAARPGSAAGRVRARTRGLTL